LARANLRGDPGKLPLDLIAFDCSYGTDASDFQIDSKTAFLGEPNPSEKNPFLKLARSRS
jgi:hypothetical protein